MSFDQTNIGCFGLSLGTHRGTIETIICFIDILLCPCECLPHPNNLAFDESPIKVDYDISDSTFKVKVDSVLSWIISRIDVFIKIVLRITNV